MLQTRYFLIGMKNARVSPRFQKDEKWLFTKCRPISVRSSHERHFRKKTVFKRFTIFTGKHLCWNKSLQHMCFPLNIAKALRIFTNSYFWLVLFRYSKLLQRLLQSRLYKYLLQHNLLYKKQLGFQAPNSEEHVVIQLN